MIVEEKKVVSLTYELRVDNETGQVVDVADENNTLDFIYGQGLMLPLFEKGIKGLSINNEFKFNIDPKNGYGEYSDEQVAELPVDIFQEDGKINEKLLFVGNVIPLRDEKNNHFNGKVVSFNDKVVVMDFNHPLAGKHLYFSGKIINIREATNDELSHGHIHKEGCCGCGGH